MAFLVESLNVSHAGANATADNAGTKLLRKPGSDSLFCVYSDLEGNVIYAASSSGDSWQRTLVASGHAWPAICQDSAVKRWVVSYNRKDRRVEARCRTTTGQGWSQPRVVYTVAQGCTLSGSIALAGSGSGDPGNVACAYCAFPIREVQSGDNQVVVAKFSQVNVGLDTVVSGTQQSEVSSPTIAVEKVQGGDHLHVGWVADGDIRYTMTAEVIDPGAWGENIGWSWETPINLSGTQAVSKEPCLGASESRIVMVWAEGSDIMAGERSTQADYDSWQDTVRLTSSQTESRYPVVSVSDSTVIVWQEQRSATDLDIVACIEYGDTFTVRNTATKSSYPHVVFQNKPSGDTAIPYVHVVWCEEPEENYFEVAYEKLNLKQRSGQGGQQTGGEAELIQPRLHACAPNPFTGATAISYQFGQAGNVSLRVYDAAGRLVTTLKQGHEQPGIYAATWQGTDQRGRQVPNGIYFYRLDAPGITAAKKAVLMR
ncbi:MAG: FlgD immunoglobulin-like domain containing protein [candidate division WOR-3 bacterium]